MGEEKKRVCVYIYIYILFIREEKSVKVNGRKGKNYLQKRKGPHKKNK